MKIFFWPADIESGCFEYRVRQQASALADRGHEVQTSQRMSSWVREEADVIVGQRIVMPRPCAMWLLLDAEDRKLGRHRLVYEVDDDLFSIDPAQNQFAKVFKVPAVRQNMREALAIARMVTVSTAPLADKLRAFNKNVVVLPNGFNKSIFDVPIPAGRGQGGPNVVIGWQGSPTHTHDWAVAQPAVQQILEEHHDTTPTAWVRFLGTPYLEGIPVDRFNFRPWTTDIREHYGRVVRFDIGLAPLAETTFNRSKSNLRVIEYMALGLPVVASDTVSYRDTIEHGRTGFLARTHDDWVRHLRDLVNDPAMRSEIGQAAREAARAWTIEDRITLWEQAYESLSP